MPLEVFTAPWAEAWGAALRDSDAYRRAAARWEGELVLVLAADPAHGVEERAVFLDLWHGECRNTRLATADDLAGARYVVRGARAVWQDVLSRRTEPLFALVAGRLKLERGSVASLTPFAVSARELVLAAAALDAEFPGGRVA